MKWNIVRNRIRTIDEVEQLWTMKYLCALCSCKRKNGTAARKQSIWPVRHIHSHPLLPVHTPEWRGMKWNGIETKRMNWNEAKWNRWIFSWRFRKANNIPRSFPSLILTEEKEIYLFLVCQTPYKTINLMAVSKRANSFLLSSSLLFV